MTAIDIAKHYFALSNDSNFDEIKTLFSENSTFCSATQELFLGVNDIMTMQRLHHGSFKQLKWIVNNLQEVKPGIIHFDFDFEGETKAGKQIKYQGLEDIIIHKGKIQHVEVRRKI